jgi:drug/metabolite transporter (DMT)-like permease
VGGGRTASTTRPSVDLRANASAELAAVLLGASVVAVRVAVREVPPLSLAVLRFGQGFLLLAERRSGLFLLGFAAVVGGVLLVNWPDRARLA